MLMCQLGLGVTEEFSKHVSAWLLATVFLQGSVLGALCQSVSEGIKEYLERPEPFALFQLFFHRNDHIRLWTLEKFLQVFIIQAIFSSPVLPSKGPGAELYCL